PIIAPALLLPPATQFKNRSSFQPAWNGSESRVRPVRTPFVGPQFGNTLTDDHRIRLASSARPNLLLPLLVQSQTPDPDWIQMHIPAQAQPPFATVDDDGFETALEKMSATAASPVKPHAVADIEPLHGTTQVWFPQLDDEVIVIVHQYVRMNE